MTKHDLQEYKKMTIELDSLEEQYTRLKAQIESPRHSVLSDMPKGGACTDWTDKVVRLVELREKYERQWDAVIDKRREIERVIDAIADPIGRALMRYKYIGGYTWEEVCVKIKYEWAQTHRLHAWCLRTINMI